MHCNAFEKRCNRLKQYDMTSEASETGMTCGGNISVMIEVFTVRPVLVMCGAGHIGEAVLRLASFVGFDTILVDNREEKILLKKLSWQTGLLRFMTTKRT